MNAPVESALLPRTGFLRPALAAALAALPLVASAHMGADAGGHHSFVDGVVHPLTGLDHLSAMLAVGLWSGLNARRAWVAPLSFASLLLVGALLATAGLAFPAVEPMIAASLLVIGLLLASQRQLPAPVAATLVGGFALFHGAAHGSELSAGPALAGMVLSTATLHLAGIGLGRWLKARGGLLPRVTAVAGGAGMAAFGASLLLG